MKRSKAYAPRKMRTNNKPTRCMRPACTRCSSMSSRLRMIVVHEEGEACPKDKP